MAKPWPCQASAILKACCQRMALAHEVTRTSVAPPTFNKNNREGSSSQGSYTHHFDSFYWCFITWHIYNPGNYLPSKTMPKLSKWHWYSASRAKTPAVASDGRTAGHVAMPKTFDMKSSSRWSWCYRPTVDPPETCFQMTFFVQKTDSSCGLTL